jgi:hypothetical protein
MSIHGVSHHPFASHSRGSSDESQNALARRALQTEAAQHDSQAQAEESHRPTRDVSHHVDKTA